MPKRRSPVPVVLNVYPNAYTPKPKRTRTCTFDDACAELLTRAQRPARSKTAMFAFNFVRLSTPYCVNENVLAHSAIAIDVDDTRTSPQELAERLRALHWNAAILCTASDSPATGVRSYRVVLEASREIEGQGDTIKLVRRGVGEALGIGPGFGIEGAESSRHIFFVGRYAASDRRETVRVPGGPVDVDDILSRGLRMAWKPLGVAVPDALSPDEIDAIEPDERTEKLVDALLEYWPAPGEDPGRRNVLRGLGGYLARNGWDDGQIAAVVRSLPTHRDDWTPDKRGRLDLALDAARTARAGRAETAGYGAVATWDRDAAAAIEPFVRHPELPGVVTGGTCATELLINDWRPGGRLRRIMDRADARSVAAETEREEKRAAIEADNAPWIAVTRSRSTTIFVRDPAHDEPQYVECQNSTAFHPIVRALGVDGYLENAFERSVLDITSEYARPIDGVECSYAVSGLGYNAERNVIVRGCNVPGYEPRFDATVDAWIESLGGEQANALRTWAAACAQRYAWHPATALLLVGQHSCGKTLFANACAWQWGALLPIALADMTERFTEHVRECPIVLDDECRVLKRGNLSTSHFRDLVDARNRRVEPKGAPKEVLRGTQRFVITANDISEFRFRDALGTGAIDALAERLLIVETDEGRARVAAGLANELRANGDDELRERLGAHFRWLWETVEVDTTPRYLAPAADRETARRILMRSTLYSNAELFDTLRTALESGEHGPGIYVGSGALWVKRRELADDLHRMGDAWSPNRISHALEPFLGARAFFKAGGRSVRALEIDAQRLAGALGCTVHANVADPIDLKPRRTSKYN